MKSHKHACINTEIKIKTRQKRKFAGRKTYSKLHKQYEIARTHVPKSRTGKGRFKHAIKPKFTGHHKLLKKDKLRKLTCTIPREGDGEGRLKHDIEPKFTRHSRHNKLLKQYKLQKFMCTHLRGKQGKGKDQAHRKTEI